MSHENTSLTTNLDNNDRGDSGEAAGATAFAGVLLVMVGIFHAIQGLVALFNDTFYVVGQEYLFRFDLTTWGWVHLVLGVVVAGAGVGMLRGALWARTVAILVASVSMATSFVWLPYYPVWGIAIIALDVFIIWAAINSGDVVDE